MNIDTACNVFPAIIGKRYEPVALGEDVFLYISEKREWLGRKAMFFPGAAVQGVIVFHRLHGSLEFDLDSLPRGVLNVPLVAVPKTGKEFFLPHGDIKIVMEMVAKRGNFFRNIFPRPDFEGCQSLLLPILNCVRQNVL